jgi:hypothetical protein
MTEWTPDQFWEYVEGLTDEHVRDQMRDMMGERGLSVLPQSSSITDEMVTEACDVYSSVYADDDKDMGDAMRAALTAALTRPVGNSK